MTFRTSLALSMAAHFALAAGAMQLAYTSRDGYSLPVVVPVVLVASGGDANSRAPDRHRRARKPAPSPQEFLRPAEPAPPEQRGERREAPEPGQPAVAASVAPESGSPAPHGNAGAESPAAAAAAGSENISGGIHAVSAEQWALIETAIERSKSYPRLARERGIQGVAVVRFKLKPTGDVEAAEIVKSSGSEILDVASIRTVYRAAPMPYVQGWISVPLGYVLK